MQVIESISKRLILALAILLTVCGAVAENLDGLYQVQGVHSERGPYAGQALIKSSLIQRIVRFDSYQHKGRAVEVVWSGSRERAQAQFQLKLSQILTGFENFQPAQEEFQNPQTVTIPLVAVENSSKIQFNVEIPGEGGITETWIRAGKPTENPLWVDLRINQDAFGEYQPFLIRVARNFGLNDVMKWYRSRPEANPWRNRPEYQKEQQFLIQDRTDADFYRANPNVLRVTNKTLNPLSLAEAEMRRNAYAPRLFEKAQFLGDQTANLNQSETGMLEVATVDEQGQKIGSLPEGDSALWTGMYAWSQALRYEKTHDPESLAAFKKTFSAILTLVEVTQDPKEFARTLRISPASENLGPNWVQGKGQFSHLKWLRGGNNDMIKGIFLGLTIAKKMLGIEDVELRARALKVAEGLPELRATAERAFNSGLAHGVKALWNGDDSEIQSFSAGVYSILEWLGNVTGAGTGFHIGGVADWSGIHLSMVSTVIQIELSEQLYKEFENSDQRYLIYHARKIGQEVLFKMQKVYRKADRHFLTLLTYAMSPEARENKQFMEDLKNAMWVLREVPAPRHIDGTAVADLSKRPEWCLSAWPALPWKALKGIGSLKPDLTFDQFKQGVYAYPIFEGFAWGSTYFWKDNPFYIAYAGNGRTISFSSDYLILYWIARSSGLITEKD